MSGGVTAARCCDVLVIGAGPAGSAAAFAAADAGAHVIMVERRQEVGSPPRCAGFVPMHFFHGIGMVNEVIAQRVERMKTHHPCGIEDNRSFGYIVHRELFDQRLAERAVDAGTELLTGHRAAFRSSEGVFIEGDGTSLLVRPRAVVGADGPISAAGRWIGAGNSEFACAAQWQMRLSEPQSAMQVFFDQEIPGGYGWLFPRGKSAAVGVAVAGGMRPLVVLRRFVSRLLDAGMVEAKVLGATGGKIPVSGPTRCRGGSILLAGDAAGHCNPVTGAGIATAFLSGELAGSAAAAFAFDGDEDHLIAYETEVEETFCESLRHAAVRRDEMLDSWQEDDNAFSAALRRSWIAFPEYARS